MLWPLVVATTGAVWLGAVPGWTGQTSLAPPGAVVEHGAAAAQTVQAATPCGPGLDANVDGYSDLAVGSPGDDVKGRADAGSVSILYGLADGGYGRGFVLTQESVGLLSEPGDRFGAALAVGDVTGDGCADLVIGVPGEDRGKGQVVVVHAGPAGMSGKARTILKQGYAGAAGVAERGDGFGSAVSVGVTTVGRGPGWGLWVGAPGEDLGSAWDAGVVTGFRVRPLTTTGSRQFSQNSTGVPGVAESGDHFGAALAGGAALVGAPGEDVGAIADAGTVTRGFRTALSQNSRGMPGAAEAGDHFGSAVAYRVYQCRDPETERLDEMPVGVAGAAGEDIGARRDAGSVTILPPTLGNENPLGVWVSQDSAGVEGGSESGDRFGASLALLERMPSDDNVFTFVVGSPGEDVGTVRDAGWTTLVTATMDCIDDSDSYMLDSGKIFGQGRGGLAGAAQAGEHFGATASALPGVVSGFAAGAPDEPVTGKPSAGSVTVVRPLSGQSQLLTRNSVAAGEAGTGDHFGTLP